VRSHSKPLLGLVYLVVLSALLLTSVQIYRKAMPWQDTVDVTLTTTTPGLELNPLSDVKLQGARVGEVRRITSDGDRAVVHLAIDPEAVDLIPADVDARILPKTLFGEKYVDLLVPAHASKQRISEGDVILQSRTSVEIGELFGRLVPILRTLRPEQVSTVLNSLADAVDGRGLQLADTAVQLEQLLGRVNPHLGTLTHDLRQLARTSRVYADSAPELVRVLGNVATTSRELLVPQEKRFAELLDTVIGTAALGTDVLRENTRNLVTLSGRVRPVLALLDEYAAVLPCTLDTLHVLDNVATHATGARGAFINLRVDLVTRRAPYTNPEDLPGNPGNDAHVSNLHPYVKSRGPYCAQLPPALYDVEPARPFSLPWPQALSPGRSTGSPRRTAPGPAAPSGTDTDTALREARDALARTIAARSLGVPVDEVPDYVGLLMAPLLVDGQVSVR
jgi:phospholipid/cholesterol/gamma-HCH transport system substrate-binding protein